MFALLVLHFEGGVSVRDTGGRGASGVVTRLERNDVGAVIQRGGCAEGGAVQRQRRAGVVEDLHADVGRAAGGRVLQRQNGGIAAVDGRTGEGDGRFGCYRGVAIIQLNVETNGQLVLPAVASFAERTWPNWTV